MHSELDNVVVLRSPNKLFGIAGVRVGVLWTRCRSILRDVRAALPTWPISFLDAHVAASGLRSAAWAGRTRERLRATAAEMESMLIASFGEAAQDVPVRYRFAPTREPVRLRDNLLRSGVVVRAFRADDPGRIPGIRVAAPIASELPRLRSVPAGPGRASSGLTGNCPDPV